MDTLSNKALILLDLLKKLGAVDVEHKTNVYKIMEKLQEVDLREILPDEPEFELESLMCEMTQKSISTTLASLERKGFVIKTGVISTYVDEEKKNIRNYYLSQK